MTPKGSNMNSRGRTAHGSILQHDRDPEGVKQCYGKLVVQPRQGC
jgi:hypothetical protein